MNRHKKTPPRENSAHILYEEHFFCFSAREKCKTELCMCDLTWISKEPIIAVSCQRFKMLCNAPSSSLLIPATLQSMRSMSLICNKENNKEKKILACTSFEILRLAHEMAHDFRNENVFFLNGIPQLQCSWMFYEKYVSRSRPPPPPPNLHGGACSVRLITDCAVSEFHHLCSITFNIPSRTLSAEGMH